MEQDETTLLQQRLEQNERLLLETRAKLEAAEQKLKEYEEKAANAEKASKMKTLFLANMSHEIRTPLNAIEGFSRVLVETPTQEERMEYLEIIDSNSNRLMALINEILDLSRVEAGEIVLKYAPCNTEQLMKNIQMLFRFRCPETVQMRYEIPQKGIMFKTDENRLTQVLSNLVSNSLKHTPKGRITYGFRLLDHVDDPELAARGNEFIQFFVKDTGSGIAPEDLPRIFGTFVSRDAETQQGFGLGLALCKVIVEKMGGKIAAESTLGSGSTFTFTLPFQGLISGHNTQQANMSTTGQRTMMTQAMKKDTSNMKTVLVAEDEDSNYELVRVVLQSRYRLLRAHNGIEAVSMAEEQPDLILMDIKMPEMDGLDATRIIKEVTPELPVIALSAHVFEANIQAAKMSGCDYFLKKPFTVEELIETVERYLEK
ncbi:MAG: response regulator [Prevotella sp.]|nr:response regulator [Prevotella sp.]